jgi:hypothetical protein
MGGELSKLLAEQFLAPVACYRANFSSADNKKVEPLPYVGINTFQVIPKTPTIHITIDGDAAVEASSTSTPSTAKDSLGVVLLLLSPPLSLFLSSFSYVPLTTDNPPPAVVPPSTTDANDVLAGAYHVASAHNDDDDNAVAVAAAAAGVASSDRTMVESWGGGDDGRRCGRDGQKWHQR